MPFLQSIKLSGLLSFPPESEAIPLTALNVLIGPNASGKSNLIEAIELLHSEGREQTTPIASFEVADLRGVPLAEGQIHGSLGHRPRYWDRKKVFWPNALFIFDGGAS